MFSILVLCALSFESIWLYVRLIFLSFGGKNPYFIKKSHIRRFDSLIYSIAYLEMFLLMILIEGLLWNDSSWVATLATVGNLFIGKIPKCTPNDVIHLGCFYVFHKILSMYQNKTFIRGASPGVSDRLWDKNAIGVRKWDVATQERNVCNVEIEIVTFVVKGSMKFVVPTDWQ